jgi:hypothetical protein
MIIALRLYEYERCVLFLSLLQAPSRHKYYSNGVDILFPNAIPKQETVDLLSILLSETADETRFLVTVRTV